jgi:hypothetical protein
MKLGNEAHNQLLHKKVRATGAFTKREEEPADKTSCLCLRGKSSELTFVAND